MRTFYFPGEKTPMAYSFNWQEAEDVGYANWRSGSSTTLERNIVVERVAKVLVPATVEIQTGRKPEGSLVVYTADPNLEGRDVAYIRNNLLRLAAFGNNSDPHNSDPRRKRVKTMLANAEVSVLGITRSEIGSMEALPTVLEEVISGSLIEDMSQPSLITVSQSHLVE